MKMQEGPRRLVMTVRQSNGTEHDEHAAIKFQEIAKTRFQVPDNAGV